MHDQSQPSVVKILPSAPPDQIANLAPGLIGTREATAKDRSSPDLDFAPLLNDDIIQTQINRPQGDPAVAAQPYASTLAGTASRRSESSKAPPRRSSGLRTHDALTGYLAVGVVFGALGFAFWKDAQTRRAASDPRTSNPRPSSDSLGTVWPRTSALPRAQHGTSAHSSEFPEPSAVGDRRQRQPVPTAQRAPPSLDRPTDLSPLAAPARLEAGQSRRGPLSPNQQHAASKPFVEGHWQGMEVVELTPALRTLNGVPAGLAGLLVDEVTLVAAGVGMLAGDVVTHVGPFPVADLVDMQQATYALRRHHRVELILWRKQETLTVALNSSQELGFAMFEGAPPIVPGAVSPHKQRGRPCTDCHLIMATGGQLAVDAGDLKPSPPPIRSGAPCPHEPRGACNACHAIIPGPPVARRP